MEHLIDIMKKADKIKSTWDTSKMPHYYHFYKWHGPKHYLKLYDLISKYEYGPHHGDLRDGNVNYDEKTGELILFDFVTVSNFPRLADPSYLIITSLNQMDRLNECLSEVAKYYEMEESEVRYQFTLYYLLLCSEICMGTALGATSCPIASLDYCKEGSGVWNSNISKVRPFVQDQIRIISKQNQFNYDEIVDAVKLTVLSNNIHIF